MKFFRNLELLQPYPRTSSFNGLRTIKERAEQILKKPGRERTPEQIDCAAIEIRSLIDENKTSRISEDLEFHVRRLHEHGGWELDFLDDYEFQRQPTLHEIRQLLENWPSWADDKPDFLQAEYIEDLNALEDVLSLGDQIGYIPGFPDATEHECYAVLALMKLDEAEGLLYVPEKTAPSGVPTDQSQYPWTAQATIAAGNLIVEAMEIICHGERKFFEFQLPVRKNPQEEENALREREIKERQIRSETAAKLANSRWAEDEEKRERAKELIKHYFNMWERDRSLYKNQGEFARDMEEKVETQIGKVGNGKLLYSSTTIAVKLIPRIPKK